jgi:hypothetical protein
MLKKILILVLALNTAYVPSTDASPSPSSPSLGLRLALGCAGSASAIGGTWLAYRGFKDAMQMDKESHHYRKILNDMGAKIDTTVETKIRSTYIEQITHRNLNIPPSFSKEKKNLAIKYWNLLVENEKKRDKEISKGALGLFILIPLGIVCVVGSSMNAN